MSIALQTDGRILVAGDFYYAGPSERLGLVRLLPNGAVEPNADSTRESMQGPRRSFNRGRNLETGNLDALMM
jgi:Domain of unknown function (DUF5122) beta-propeller